MTILKLMWRTLLVHRLRLVFSAVAVLLGVSFVSGTLIFRDTAASAFSQMIQARSDAPEVMVRPKQQFTSADAPPTLVPQTVLTTLRESVPTADDIRSLTEDYAAIVKPDGTVVGGTATVQRGRVLDETPRAGSPTRIVSGRFPRGVTEVAVEEHTLTEGDLRLNDEVVIVTRSGTNPMKVVGVFTLGESKGFGSLATYVGFDAATGAALLATPGQYSSVWVIPRSGTNHDEFVRQVTAALPSGYDVVTANKQSQQLKKQVDELFNLISTVLLAFAGISVLVGSFTIFNTFTMLVAQRSRELALLRAIGATASQTRWLVVAEASLIGVIGSTLGVPFGIGVAALLRRLFAAFGADLPSGDIVVSPVSVLAGYLAGVSVTVLAAYLPAARASAIPPVAAMRAGSVPQSRPSRVRTVIGTVLALLGVAGIAVGAAAEKADRLPIVAVGAFVVVLATFSLMPALTRPLLWLFGRPLTIGGNIEGSLSVENARRSPRRTAATSLALVIGLALVTLATVFASSMSRSATDRLDREFGADFSVQSRGLSGFSPSVLGVMRDVPGVGGVTSLRTGTILVGNKEQAVAVGDAAALTNPLRLRAASGELRSDAGTVLVRQSAAQEKGWTVGKSIAVTYPDGVKDTLTVSGVFQDSEIIQQPFLLSDSTYGAHTRTELVQRAFVEVARGSALSDVRPALERALAATPNLAIEDRSQAQDAARSSINQALAVVGALLVLSIAVAALGIVNTLSLSVVERTREIGLLRAVGMTRLQVGRSLVAESVLITLLGALVGIGLGVILGIALQQVWRDNGVESLDLAPTRLLLYLVGALVIAVFSALWPVLRATRMRVLDAIQQE